jgi:hypothetical protein
VGFSRHSLSSSQEPSCLGQDIGHLLPNALMPQASYLPVRQLRRVPWAAGATAFQRTDGQPLHITPHRRRSVAVGAWVLHTLLCHQRRPTIPMPLW